MDYYLPMLRFIKQFASTAGRKLFDILDILSVIIVMALLVLAAYFFIPWYLEFTSEFYDQLTIMAFCYFLLLIIIGVLIWLLYACAKHVKHVYDRI